MCALCGVLSDGPHWTEAGTDGGRAREAPAGRARHLERRHRLALLNRILAAYGCKADDWAGAQYLVHNRSGGATEVVADLPRIWLAVERLIRRPPDPLDPDLVSVLEEAALPTRHAPRARTRRARGEWRSMRA